MWQMAEASPIADTEALINLLSEALDEVGSTCTNHAPYVLCARRTDKMAHWLLDHGVSLNGRSEP